MFFFFSGDYHTNSVSCLSKVEHIWLIFRINYLLHDRHIRLQIKPIFGIGDHIEISISSNSLSYETLNWDSWRFSVGDSVNFPLRLLDKYSDVQSILIFATSLILVVHSSQPPQLERDEASFAARPESKRLLNHPSCKICTQPPKNTLYHVEILL